MQFQIYLKRAFYMQRKNNKQEYLKELELKWVAVKIESFNVFSEALIVFNQNWNEGKFIRHFGHTYITSHNTTHTTIVFECHTNFSQTIYKTNILICALTAHNRYSLPFHRLSTMCSNNNKHKNKNTKTVSWNSPMANSCIW